MVLLLNLGNGLMATCLIINNFLNICHRFETCMVNMMRMEDKNLALAQQNWRFSRLD